MLTTINVPATGRENIATRFAREIVYALLKLPSQITPSTRPNINAALLKWHAEIISPITPAMAIIFTSAMLMFVAYEPIIASMMIIGPKYEYGTAKICANTLAIAIATITIRILVTTIEAKVALKY